MPTGKDQDTELEAQVTTLEKTVQDLTKKLEVAAAAGGDAAKSIELQGQVSEMSEALDKMTKLLEEASAALEEQSTLNKALSQLSPEELVVAKAMDAEDYKDGGADEDKEDASGKKKTKKRLAKFLDMSKDDRAKYMADLQKKDETVEIAGRTIRKSVVGDDAFAVMKSQAADIAKGREDLEIEKKAREKAVFEKTADEKYAHVPGTAAERADMLIAVSKMEEPLQKLFTKVFEQSEALGKAGFGKLGVGGGDKPGEKSKITKAVVDFEKKASEIAARDKIGKEAAFSKARKENPDLFKAYQEAGQEGASTQ